MKKTLLSFLFGAFALAAGAQDVVSDAVGVYSGDLWVALMAPVDTTDADTKLSDQTVYLTVGEEANTIDFALYDFTFAGASVGDIVLSSIPVSTDEAGNIVFGENPAVELSLAEGVILATAQINTEGSFINGDDIEVTIDVVWTNGGDIPINVFFKGTKTVADGISGVTTSGNATGERSTGVYTLSGRRVNATGETGQLPAGLYIVNGKKTIIK